MPYKYFDNSKQNLYFVITFFYLFLIIAFIYSLDPNGGAYPDYLNQKKISQNFAVDFKYELFNFDKTTTRHSPVLLIILSFFERYEINDYLIRIINLHFCLLLPILFYKIITLKYKSINFQNKILLSCLVFLSPTFISLSIWPDSRIYGLIFFCLALIEYLKFEQEKKFSNSIKCVVWYAISSYFSLNFALFAIFFLYKFFLTYKLSNKFIYILIFNFILSTPALLYVFSLDTIFFLKSGIAGKSFESLNSLNYFNKIIIIPSIIFFYLIPFYFTKLIKIDSNIFKVYNIILSLLVFLISIFFFDYRGNYSGGGIFFKISNYFFLNNLIFYFIGFLSILIVSNICRLNFDNFLIIFLLILSNVQYSIYHKYYDPFLFILFFSIINLNFQKQKLKDLQVSYFYLFVTFFLILNLLKNNF